MDEIEICWKEVELIWEHMQFLRTDRYVREDLYECKRKAASFEANGLPIPKYILREIMTLDTALKYVPANQLSKEDNEYDANC